MFLAEWGAAPTLGGFPRVRGDVPESGYHAVVYSAFSPRARGCSVASRKFEDFDVVFPACAGMFPTKNCIADSTNGFPRMRGDVPV